MRLYVEEWVRTSMCFFPGMLAAAEHYVFCDVDKAALVTGEVAGPFLHLLQVKI